MHFFIRVFFACVTFVFASNYAFSQLNVTAGLNKTICLGDTVKLGGTPTASGGTAPYSYSWSPAAGLSSATVANPNAVPSKNTTYKVYVIDSLGQSGVDSVRIDIFKESLAGAINDTTICISDSIQLGNSNSTNIPGVTYTWTPTTGIGNAYSPSPNCLPQTTTTYTVTINGPNCPAKTDVVTVTANKPPVVTATGTATINQGESTQVSASGATQYSWIPGPYIASPTSATTLVYPQQTTTYYVVGADANGCYDYDTITITVKPTKNVILYNTFTPNGDGVNDNFFIGNIFKYPDNKLTVYSRYGKVVYTSKPYQNNWNGKSDGEELPAATYYFVLELGDGYENVYGSVTIIR